MRGEISSTAYEPGEYSIDTLDGDDVVKRCTHTRLSNCDNADDDMYRTLSPVICDVKGSVKSHFVDYEPVRATQAKQTYLPRAWLQSRGYNSVVQLDFILPKK